MPALDLATIDQYLEQIDELVRGAADTDDLQFRIRLEELVKKGGRSTENAIALYITGKSLGLPTRLNLVRLAGYIRSAAFLLPLRQVIETGEDDLLREEAIISISKYNDRRALDILAKVLDMRMSRPLQDAVTQAISRIRHNSPVLAMLPRFLQGSRNRELHEITQKIFMRILGPAEAKGFISYLNHSDPLVAAGSFEILCARGDETVVFFIEEFFREQSRMLLPTAGRPVGGERLASLVAALHDYLKRYPRFLPQLRTDLEVMLPLAGAGPLGEALSALLALKVPVEGTTPQNGGSSR
ncbi:MAG: HEAT repeat domain-containing protein [Acidobacteria bacterium]|nr:HEAT repeat domain-containing protein [Acidobacteriota bacterium]